MARDVGDALGYSYFSFDDLTLREAAKADPVGFIAELPPKVVLDEVQRTPEIFASLKEAIDRERRPGRAILTGSANVLLVPNLSDSLAGRMEDMGDSGLAAALLGADADALARDCGLLGQLLETFVVQELRRLASWQEDAHVFHHYRDKDGYEVDAVIERGAQGLAGVEVKASSTVVAADFRGLRRLRDGAGDRFQAGVVLYDGEKTLRFEESLHAVPIAALWEDRG